MIITRIWIITVKLVEIIVIKIGKQFKIYFQNNPKEF